MDKMTLLRSRLFRSSGLDQFSFETRLNPEKPDRIYIIYRDPVTDKTMKTPDGRAFRRCKVFMPGGKEVYRTCKGGGLHLYFPDCDRGKVTDFLEANPDEPVYITEGEKKAAKAWLEGIPCVGISGIWCWLANKEDRPNDEKILHPDLDFIPDLNRRGVIMVYDSDANDPEKKADFDKCSEASEKCLRARGVNWYEKIVLPSEGLKKMGLDDYLMRHSVADFNKLAAEQSKTILLDKYIMSSRRFLSTNFPPINFVFQPWLTDCGLTMIHSRPGLGETFFLSGLYVAITRKKLPEDFCGWKIKKGVGVSFVDGEMPAPEMQKRLAKVEAAYPKNPPSKENKLSLLSCTHHARQTGKIINFSEEYWRN
jgi:hypothetical protein